MADNVYKMLEITSESTKSIEDAVNIAVATATESEHDVRWVEIVDIRGNVTKGKVERWQLTLKLAAAVAGSGR